MGIVQAISAFLRAVLVGRAALAAENPALRHSIGVLQRSVEHRHNRVRYVSDSKVNKAFCETLRPERRRVTRRDSLVLLTAILPSRPSMPRTLTLSPAEKPRG